MTAKMVRCPFCGEDDFDLPGLKNHLLFFCSAYDSVEQLRPPLFACLPVKSKGKKGKP